MNHATNRFSLRAKKNRSLRPSYNCDGLMARARFRRNRKRAVWRKLTPPRRRQRTTMKACLFTVTKCHKNAQSHRAPTCAPTPARCRVHSRARRRQLRVPPANCARHHRIHTSHIQIIIQMFNGKPLRRKRSSTHTTWSHVTYCHNRGLLPFL